MKTLLPVFLIVAEINSGGKKNGQQLLSVFLGDLERKRE